MTKGKPKFDQINRG